MKYLVAYITTWFGRYENKFVTCKAALILVVVTPFGNILRFSLAVGGNLQDFSKSINFDANSIKIGLLVS